MLWQTPKVSKCFPVWTETGYTFVSRAFKPKGRDSVRKFVPVSVFWLPFWLTPNQLIANPLNLSISRAISQTM